MTFSLPILPTHPPNAYTHFNLHNISPRPAATAAVYQIVVPKQFLSDDLVKVLDGEPLVLPAWDPMGSLATRNSA